MNARYTLKTIVSISDCDPSGRPRPSSILIQMQELGEVHAASYGLSRQHLGENGMCWVLYRQRIVMDAYPTFGDEIAISTWPGTVEGPVFPRHFLFERPNGERIGRAVTAWVLMNIETRRPLRPTALPGEVPIHTGRETPLPLPGMLRLPASEPLGTRTVHYSDLDVNGHMNNTRYIDWVCDLLDYPTLSRRGLGEWQINYTAEALPGDTLALYQAEDEGGILVQGKRPSDGRTVFDARTVFL